MGCQGNATGWRVARNERSGMTEELSGRRIVVPETRELGQLVRMLEERGAEAIPCPMIGIRDAPDAEPVAAWLHWFVKRICDDLVLMTGEGLRRLLGLARRIDLESAFLDALRTTRKIARGPKPVRALREVGLDADIPADEPTTDGIIAAMRRHDLSGRSVGVQLNPGNPNRRLVDVVAAVGPIVASELEALGVQVNITPPRGTFFMKPLVRELAAALTKEGKAGAA